MLQGRTGAPIFGFGPQLRIDDPDQTQVVFGDPELDHDPARPTVPRGGDLAFKPDVLLRDGERVQGSNWTLEIIHSPGHASNHLCYRVSEDDALCTGDHVMSWSTSVISPPDGDLAEYLQSMETLIDRLEDRLYLPGHGPPIYNPRTFVRALIDHRHYRDRQILDFLSRGPATIADMVPSLYAGVAKKLWPAASASVYAHLIRLEGAGMLQSDDGTRLVRASRVRRSN